MYASKGKTHRIKSNYNDKNQSNYNMSCITIYVYNKTTYMYMYKALGIDSKQYSE